MIVFLSNSAERGTVCVCVSVAVSARAIIKIFISANCRLLRDGCVVRTQACTHTNKAI